jgi:hypothetical protein
VVVVVEVVEDKPEVTMDRVVMVVVVEMALEPLWWSIPVRISRMHMLTPMEVVKPITKMVGAGAVKVVEPAIRRHTTKKYL